MNNRYIGNNEQKSTIYIASNASNCSAGYEDHDNGTESSVQKDTLAGHLPLLLGCSLVAPNHRGPMACHFHKLLIKVHLIHFHGGHQMQGVIGVVARQASITTHVADYVPQLVNSSWSIQVPGLPKELCTGLEIEGLARMCLWQESHVLQYDVEGAAVWPVQCIHHHSLHFHLLMLEPPLVCFRAMSSVYCK